MTPIFRCLICRKDIERSTKTYWVKRGHLLCSSCLDEIEKKTPDQLEFFLLLFKSKTLEYIYTRCNYINKENNKLFILRFPYIFYKIS